MLGKESMDKVEAMYRTLRMLFIRLTGAHVQHLEHGGYLALEDGKWASDSSGNLMPEYSRPSETESSSHPEDQSHCNVGKVTPELYFHLRGVFS